MEVAVQHQQDLVYDIMIVKTVRGRADAEANCLVHLPLKVQLVSVG